MINRNAFSVACLSIFLFLTCGSVSTYAQFVDVESGSYTTVFPGVDAANRNTYPSGTPCVSGNASGKPAPTNDWWSSKIKENHVSNIFNYPFTLKTVNAGLVVSYIPWGVIDDLLPVTVGVTGMNASKATVSDFSDWTVTMDWNDGTHQFNVTTGMAMPFLYFTKADADVVQITCTSGTITITGEMLVVTNAKNGADFAVYAPSGSEWIKNGNLYTSTLNGQNYWSLAFIPLTASDITTVATEYKKYAYVFPVNTRVNWQYNEATSVVRTDFTIETSVKEGADTTVLQGLLPHQWAHLAAGSPVPDQYSYASIRGEIKTLAGNHFSVENAFHGILPTLPYVSNYSPGFNPAAMIEKEQLLENESLATWTDSYNEGQSMNRLIQTARVAHETENIVTRDKIIETIKERLEDWLKAESGEVAFLFYYNSTWSSLLGYPAGHGQDGNLNDHHFHWGYFIHAAAFVEQFQPGWANHWGEMINLLVRDAASTNRADTLFPFLRNFSPYAGHCWANGFATFPQGNDQESTSESMQFNSSLIHWGTITGNKTIRDLGIYLYTTEQTAIEEYWFDMYERNFPASQAYSLVSRVWGNSYDNGTFWTSDIAASYGIEMYPIHGGSLYLGQNQAYATKLWNEIKANTGIMNNEANDNLWHDIMWEYLAFTDPQAAIDLYDSYPNRSLKFGITDAQTYYWLHAMNALGQVDAEISANYPVAAAFVKEGEVTYVAQNYSDTVLLVTFSDGYELTVPPHKMATSKDISISGTLTSDFNEAFANGSVWLTVTIDGKLATKIEFFDGALSLGSVTELPYQINAKNLTAGKHSFFAKIYDGDLFNVTNIVSVVVGRQLPYPGTAIAIPGTFQAGWYDKFEGGNGQGISYMDATIDNQGDFRPTEYVDASESSAEGATVGWVSPGEWLEYSINVETPGFYDLTFRYACDNDNGGGPFYLLLDGDTISSAITVSSTGAWDTWKSKTINSLPLPVGEHVLRVLFGNGEMNLGKMTFGYTLPLNYDQPVANAGPNQIVVIPADAATLDGSGSSDPDVQLLTFQWSQVYGPSQVNFSDAQAVNPEIHSLTEGVYLIKLTVSNGSYSDEDEMFVIVSTESNVSPTVSITSPSTGSEYIEGEEVTITAEASDLDGTIEQVDFYEGESLIGTATTAPYSITWTAIAGDYQLTAEATDNGGKTSVSNVVTIHFTEAPPCGGTAYNGEYDYLFSDADNNPNLTFIPSIEGMGSPTCILYYGTNQNSMPGYYVTPNVPYRLTASEGSTVYFYYTYSYPGQGEHNSSANKDSYVIGSCVSTAIEGNTAEPALEYYPNPVTSVLHLHFAENSFIMIIADISGKRLQQYTSESSSYALNMDAFKPGIYFIEIKGQNHLQKIKVIKK